MLQYQAISATAIMKCYFILGVILVTVISSVQSYYIGIAQYDITGPAAEIGMVSLVDGLLPALCKQMFCFCRWVMQILNKLQLEYTRGYGAEHLYCPTL